MSRVAVVGLGQMGGGIARCLDKVGALHAALDSKPDQRQVVGLSDGVSDAIEETDVLIFVTPSTAEVADVLDAMTLREGQVVVDLTTSHPDASTALAAKVAGQGVAYVDAAMTGGAAGADAGTLTLMMGGEEDVIACLAPTLDLISNSGSIWALWVLANAMKLVHNLILHSAFMATCEGLTLAKKAGLDVDRAVEVLNAGNARSFVTEVRFPRDILGGVMNGRSRIANLEKDLGLAREFAAAQGGPSVYTDLTHDLLNRAVLNGEAETDFSYLFPMIEGLAKGRADG